MWGTMRGIYVDGNQIVTGMKMKHDSARHKAAHGPGSQLAVKNTTHCLHCVGTNSNRRRYSYVVKTQQARYMTCNENNSYKIRVKMSIKYAGNQQSGGGGEATVCNPGTVP